jgi:hypothetical protein
MGRKRRKNRKEKSAKKDLRALKNLRKGGGGYLVRVYGDTAMLRGTILDNKNGLVRIQHKRPGLGTVISIVAEENVQAFSAGTQIVRGVPTLEFFATAIVRKDGITYAKTLEGEKVTILGTSFEITSLVEEESSDEGEDSSEDSNDDDESGDTDDEKSSDDDEDEDEGKKKKKKKKKDDDEDESESSDDEDDKKKSDDDDSDSTWDL